MIKRTDIERRLRIALTSLGERFREQPRDMLGKPDFVLDGRRVLIFADGCVWHGCPRCPPMPVKENFIFWEAKVLRTAKRDKEVTKTLETQGWEVHRFWGCELSTQADCLKAVRKALKYD